MKKLFPVVALLSACASNVNRAPANTDGESPKSEQLYLRDIKEMPKGLRESKRYNFDAPSQERADDLIGTWINTDCTKPLDRSESFKAIYSFTGGGMLQFYKTYAKDCGEELYSVYGIAEYDVWDVKDLGDDNNKVNRGRVAIRMREAQPLRHFKGGVPVAEKDAEAHAQYERDPALSYMEWRLKGQASAEVIDKNDAMETSRGYRHERISKTAQEFSSRTDDLRTWAPYLESGYEKLDEADAEKVFAFVRGTWTAEFCPPANARASILPFRARYSITGGGVLQVRHSTLEDGCSRETNTSVNQYEMSLSRKRDSESYLVRLRNISAQIESDLGRIMTLEWRKLSRDRIQGGMPRLSSAEEIVRSAEEPEDLSTRRGQ